MERFYQNEPEPDGFFPEDPDEDFDDDEAEAMAEFVEFAPIYDMKQLQIAQIEINHNLMDKAISIAEKSIFWRFRTLKSKLSKIHVTYEYLKFMTGSSLNEENH